uniref:Uncharacterized protein n=1 Tax=Rhizophora mucronata TaxID=61149 RepID=A0A2P2PU03_RHIMU
MSNKSRRWNSVKCFLKGMLI